MHISIHAPTRGATVFLIVLFMTGVNFNPRSHERSDSCISSSVLSRPYFNPRSHERSDHSFFKFSSRPNISIHAPTRGATVIVFTTRRVGRFQSTLPREERLVGCCLRFNRIYFNPRSHERSDSNIAQKICLFLYNTDNKYIIR